MAVAMLSGTAIAIASAVTRSVPTMSGSIPNDGGDPAGFQSTPPRKFQIPVSRTIW